MNNETQRLRCTQCGQVDVPKRMPGGPGWIALALWAISSLVWAIGFILTIPALLYAGIVLLLPALIYTLWYFFRREQACRHCGGRTLGPASG